MPWTEACALPSLRPVIHRAETPQGNYSPELTLVEAYARPPECRTCLGQPLSSNGIGPLGCALRTFGVDGQDL